MASKGATPVRVDRNILSVKDCIAELKQEFKDTTIPIDDDNTTFHQFCIRLEYILQYEIKEKTSFLGSRKDYWDFFCKCLASKRNTHDGLKYVKSLTEAKTSVGRGRAFIRFCLMHKCLADTLQQCVINVNIARDWYGEKSPLLQESQSSILISALYDLNDMLFDLSPWGYDLDVAWPSFSRKVFSSPNAWRPPSRSVSICSFNSMMSMQNEVLPSRHDSRDELEDHVLSPLESPASVVEEENNEQLQSANQMIEFSEREKEWRQREADLESRLKQVEQVAEEYRQRLSSGGIENGMAENLKPYMPTAKINETIEKNNNLKEKMDEFFNVCPLWENGRFLEQLELARVEMVNMVSEQQRLLKTMAEVECSARDGVDSQTPQISLQHSQMKNSLEMLTKELECCQLKLDSQQKSNQLIVEQASALKDALSTTKKIMDLKDKEIDRLRALRDLHQNQFQELSVKLKEKVKMAAGVNEGMKKKISGLEASLNDQQDEKKKLSSMLDEIVTKKRELEEQVDDKSKKLETSELRLKEMNDKVQCISSLVGKQTTQIDCLTNQLEESQEEGRNLAHQVGELSELLSQKHEAVNVECPPEISSGTDTVDTGVRQQDLHPQETTIIVNDTNVSEVSIGNSVPESLETIGTTSDLAAEPEPSGSGTAFGSIDQPPIIKRTLTRLHSLIEEKIELEQELETSKDIASTLLNKVEQQEEELSSVTMELDRTKTLVAKLQAAFSTLQTNEAILRYELREKRTLMNKLKVQLETSREQWKKVRAKNTESELEWQSLRDEFANRRKQSSEESGYSEENSKVEEVDTGSCSAKESGSGDRGTPLPESEEADSVSPAESIPLAEEIILEEESVEEDDPRNRRLKFLEEQCRLLCEKLLNTAKTGRELDLRLTSISDHCATSSTSANDRTVYASSSDDQCETVRETRRASSDDSLIHEDVTMSLEEGTEAQVAEEIVREALNEVLVTGTYDDKQLDASCSGGSSVDNENPPSELKATIISSSRGSRNFKPPAFVLAHALPKRVEKLRKDKEDLEGELAKLHNAREIAEVREVTLKAKVDLLQIEKDDLQTKLEAARKELRSAKVSKESKLASEEKRAKFELIMAAKQELQAKLEGIEEQMNAKAELVSRLEENLLASQQELNNSRATLEQEVSALKFQLSTEAMKQKDHISKSAQITSMGERMNAQEMTISLLGDELEKVKTDRISDKDTQFKEWEVLQMKLATRDEECVALHEHLKEMAKKLEDEQTFSKMCKMETDKFLSSKQKSESELVELRSDIGQLHKRIIRLTREKDLLWKQKNQLSYWQKFQTDEGWMDDKQATRCLGCSAEFSLLLRKHHCRLCGRVFCYNCANNWILTSSSSHKARACAECFMQHSQFEADESSLLANSDSEEELGSIDPNGNRFVVGHNDVPSSENGDTSIYTSVDSLSERGSRLGHEQVGTCSIDFASSILLDPDDEDFHVINGEDVTNIASPVKHYRPSLLDAVEESSIVMDSNRTAVDIEELMSSGKCIQMWITAGMKHAIPILLESSKITLHWDFTSESKSIAFSMTFNETESEKSNRNEVEVLIHTTRCNSHLHAIQGRLVAKKAGIYTLIFDNSFSKFMSKKVNLFLRIEKSNPGGASPSASTAPTPNSFVAMLGLNVTGQDAMYTDQSLESPSDSFNEE